MAGNQSVRDDMGVAEWMDGRRRDIERFGDNAELIGREVWAAATTAGKEVAARSPAELRALGAGILEDRSRTRQAFAASMPVGPLASDSRSSSPSTERVIAPSGEDLTELRRRQAEFRDVRRDLDRENRWMALPALAPAVAVMGIGAIEAAGARLAGPTVSRLPHAFSKRDPVPRVGDNWATRAGRRAHEEFRRRVNEKPGWSLERNLVDSQGRRMRPDALTRKDDAVELKPNTPSGRAKGAGQVERYKDGGARRARVIYYDPKGFI